MKLKGRYTSRGMENCSSPTTTHRHSVFNIQYVTLLWNKNSIMENMICLNCLLWNVQIHFHTSRSQGGLCISHRSRTQTISPIWCFASGLSRQLGNVCVMSSLLQLEGRGEDGNRTHMRGVIVSNTWLMLRKSLFGNCFTPSFAKP